MAMFAVTVAYVVRLGWYWVVRGQVEVDMGWVAVNSTGLDGYISTLSAIF